MATEAQQWEHHLLAMAQEGLIQPSIHKSLPADSEAFLAQAYAECALITRRHSRTFYLASALLPKPKRNAARALYAFARISDDIVDQPGPDPIAKLMSWRKIALDPNPAPYRMVPLAWADARRRFKIPVRFAEQLINGIARDIHQPRYENFTELAIYCYGVASTVGLMSMHITGYSGPEAVPYAIRLGVALQLTNILRDVAEDWQRGRLYLPLEEMQAFGLTSETVARGENTPAWRKFMRFQIDRVRRLYKTSLSGVKYLDPDGRFAIAAAGELYQGILDDIEAFNYDVFSRRAYLSTAQKIKRLPGIWMRSRSGSYD